jgi:Leucine-rich repeat (LRR) protein
MGNSGSSSGSLSEHITHASKTGVCSLQSRDLKEVPAKTLGLKDNLRTLDISENKINIIPPWIGEFQVLKSLNLSKNSITHLPCELSQLKKLEILNVSFNSLSYFPDSFVNFKALKTVNISHNQLKQFPLFLCQLTQVNFVDLSSNCITSIPAGIEVISAVEINLNQNQISLIPESVSQCQRLKVLRLEENCISLMGVPPVVLRDSNISLLCLDGNPLSLRELAEMPEHDKYMERFTASKKKAL